MYKCIANNENLFLVLDTKDGACEWTTIQDCRKYLEGGIKIEGLDLKSIDVFHSYLDFNPVADFIPSVIDKELKLHSRNRNEHMKLIYIVKSYIMRGGNIVSLRKASDSFEAFRQSLERGYTNGQYVTATAT